MNTAEVIPFPESNEGDGRRYHAPDPIKYISETATNLQIPDDFSLAGWVYVLSNEAMPGLYKIGMTTSDPETRAAEISHGTGVPLPYKVEMAFFSADPRRDEAEIHEYLAPVRINPSREFFRCSIETLDLAFTDLGLIERCSPVETLADSYQVITFDSRPKMRLKELFEELDINVFGNLEAAAEGLIRLSALIIKRRHIEGDSLVIHNGTAQMITTETQQMYEHHILRQTEAQKETGIYGPKQPGGF